MTKNNKKTTAQIKVGAACDQYRMVWKVNTILISHNIYQISMLMKEISQRTKWKYGLSKRETLSKIDIGNNMH